MNYLVALIWSVSLMSYALEQRVIVCPLSDIKTQNSFSLNAVIDYANGHWDSAVEVTRRKRGPNVSLEQTFQRLGGEYKVFDSGEITLKKVYSLTHTDRSSDITLAKINVGHPGAFSSSIITSDGVTYKTRCKFQD